MGGLRDDLRDLLEAVRAGTTTPDDALDRLSQLPYRDLGFARVDTHRELRQGAPEAILAEGKTPEQVAAICRAAQLDQDVEKAYEIYEAAMLGWSSEQQREFANLMRPQS